MKFTTTIIFGFILGMPLNSCAVAKQKQTTYSEKQCCGKFQRHHQWNGTCQTNEILTIDGDGSFSICIKETSNGIDTVYYCEGVYWMSLESEKNLSSFVFQTRDAHKSPSIDRIAYPVDAAVNRINLWSSHDVCVYIRGCDTLYETSNAVPYIRIQACEVLNSGCP